MDASNHKTKGMFLKSVIKAVEREKGPEGRKQLEKLYGPLNFSGFEDYPMEEEMKLNKAAIVVLYGEENAEAWKKFGRLDAKTYVNSLIGKTMFSLLGNDLKKIGLAMAKILNTITIGYKVTVEDLGENHIKITLGDCPDRMEYFEGVFYEAIYEFGYEPIIIAKELAPNMYEYDLEWNGKLSEE